MKSHFWLSLVKSLSKPHSELSGRYAYFYTQNHSISLPQTLIILSLKSLSKPLSELSGRYTYFLDSKSFNMLSQISSRLNFVTLPLNSFSKPLCESSGDVLTSWNVFELKSQFRIIRSRSESLSQRRFRISQWNHLNSLNHLCRFLWESTESAGHGAALAPRHLEIS